MLLILSGFWCKLTHTYRFKPNKLNHISFSCMQNVSTNSISVKTYLFLFIALLVSLFIIATIYFCSLFFYRYRACFDCKSPALFISFSGLKISSITTIKLLEDMHKYFFFISESNKKKVFQYINK